jgi:response regulator RpfG family c-di-GMP phosphodiesterase
MQAIIDLINKGNIYRFLTKPCAQEDMITSIDSAIRMYELAAAEKELLGKTLGGSIKVLADLLALAKPQAFNKTQKIRSLAKSIYSELVIDGKWQIEIAATLSQIGCVTIPDDILKKVYKGLTLSESENVMFTRHPSIGADMISKIPRLEKVAEIIRYQEKNYDGTGFPADDVNEELIPEGSRILKIALDYDKAVTSGVEGDKALYDMSKKTGVYDPFFLSIAGTKFTKINSPSQQYLKEELSGENLKEEMYLSEDLVTATGVTIGARNQKLTQALIATIINYQENNQLKDKVKVVSIIG